MLLGLELTHPTTEQEEIARSWLALFPFGGSFTLSWRTVQMIFEINI